MKISQNTKKKGAINTAPKYTCEFCNREFIRESTVLKHVCTYKHRYLEQHNQVNRISFKCFLEFYKKNSINKNVKTYVDFIKSPYYTAFIKFGNYCVDVNVINIPLFLDWLLKNQIKIDTWTSDSVYTKFLIEYLRNEDPFDAILRSVETTLVLAQAENIQCKDILRYGNSNKICYQITLGKLSPWLLYQSTSGKDFLSKLDESQVKMLIDYINPELWAIKFNRYPDIVLQIKDILSKAGY